MNKKEKDNNFDSILIDLVSQDVDEEKVPMMNLSDTEVMIREEPYVLAVNYRQGFNFDEFHRLYQDYYEKYDYIVGDWAHEKLRLRGFYQINQRRVAKDRIIDYLDDYLKEYCNFGCAYFVLGKEEAVKDYPNLLPAYQEDLQRQIKKGPKSNNNEAQRDRSSYKKRKRRAKKKEEFVIKPAGQASSKKDAHAVRIPKKNKGTFVIKKRGDKNAKANASKSS